MEGKLTKLYVLLKLQLPYISLQAPPPTPHLPVLYYTVSHNVSDDGSDRQSIIHTVSTQLEGAEAGQTYYIVVYAVNAVGEGLLSARVTVTGKPILYCIIQ